MPTPTTPAKPVLPGNATTDDQDQAATPGQPGGLKTGAQAVGMSAVQRLAAIAQGKNPDAQAMGPAQGEKAFVIKTQKDPSGSIHVYAKNENDAKQKYQQLGNPLGNALMAQQVDEAGYGRREIDDEANLLYIYRDGRVKQRMVDNHEERSARREGYRDSPEQALKLHGIIRSKFNPNKWVQKQGDKWVEVHPFGKPDVKEGEKSPMFKDAQKADRIRSLKNLIAIAKEQGRQLRVQELELELKKLQGVTEGSSNVGNSIKSLYQKIYRAGDDEVEYFYNDSPIFAQYWDEYEGDLDSIIAEVDPTELQVIHDELESYVQNANLSEDFASSFSKRLGKAYDSGASSLGWKYEQDAPKWDPDAEEAKPFSNYRKGWIQHNKKFGMGADERKQDGASEFSKPESKTKTKKNSRGQQPFHIATMKDRAGGTVIMATSPQEAKAEWERKYGMTGDRIIKVMTAQEANIGESMTTTTTLKTTFEGLEDTIAGLLEEYGLENGRDFYIDGTIRTVSEQVAQDILSVLSDFELPGQTNMRKLDEQYNISLIGQGEEPVDSLRIGSDSVEIKHIGEGFVRVYVNNELAETFDNGTAAFKYVKALQENLAEAEHELLSAMTAEAGEDLMKISNITEGWDDMMKAVKDRNGPQPNGGSGVKKGKRYGGADQNDDEKEEAPKDADGNPVKRGRGRPKKVREGLDSIRKMRKQVAEALARIERLPEDQRNSVRVQSVVQALEESVRTAIKKAM